MKRFTLALLVTFIVVPGGFAQPQSGYIRHMGYRIDQGGKRSQPSISSKTWFTTKREFVRENETIHYSIEKITTHLHGKESVYSSERDLSAKEALTSLSGYLRQPYWPGVVSKGRERWKGRTVDVYVPDPMRQVLGMKWWVLDHPQFGTITVKRTEENQNRVIEVDRIWIDDNMK